MNATRSRINILLGGLVVFSVLTLARHAVAQPVAVPLEWSRSSAFVSGPGFGTEVAATLSLSTDITDPAQVWDSTYIFGHPSPPVGTLWASWFGAFQCNFQIYAEARRFRATFTLAPRDIAAGITRARLYDPLKELLVLGGAIPINDALYVYVNGTSVAQRSASFPAAGIPGYGTLGVDAFFDTTVAPETDGWYVTAIQIPPVLLVPDLNQIDVIAEETCFAGGLGFVALELTVGREQVTIDIEPGSFPNSINPQNEGRVPVAILGTAISDAASIDPTTVRFGASGTEAAAVHSALEDVDGDEKMDLILHFNTQDTGIQCGHTLAFLTGETLFGQVIQGSDSIQTAGCK